MSKEQLNRAVLSRYDPLLEKIFFISAICNVYKFDVESEEWDKINCQGTIFVYSRQAGKAMPFPYALTVLNRLSLTNFSLGITPLSESSKMGSPDMNISYEEPFLMVQAADGAMYGLWIFHEADRAALLRVLKWCLDTQFQPLR